MVTKILAILGLMLIGNCYAQWVTLPVSLLLMSISIKAKVETIWFSPGVLAQDSTTENCPSANILINASVAWQN